MSEPAQAYPCPKCGKPYSFVNPKEWHVDPGICRSCRECPDCKALIKLNKGHSPCATCRQNFCMEHGMDRRYPYHPSYCQPGEW